MRLPLLLLLLLVGVALSERRVRPRERGPGARRGGLVARQGGQGVAALEAEGVKFLDELNTLSSQHENKAVLAEWDYATNITEQTQKNKLEASAELAKFRKEIWARLSKFPWRQFKNPDVKRQFKLASVLGTAALPEKDFSKLTKMVSQMESIYAKAKICSFKNATQCNLTLDPEITELLQTSRDEAELRHVFVEWRRATGEKMRQLYPEYVRLSNQAAVLNNFTDAAAMWLHSYETDDFKVQMSELWDQLKPLYLQLHAYVRRHLREKYGEAVVKKDGPIPAHLLGNMWAQSWGNVAEFMRPYPKRQSIDVTASLVEQGYTPYKMFRLSEQFFTSLNLSAMPDEFWENSILEKPTDGRELQCHPFAFDFYDAKDFRIKQCTRVTQQHLSIAHHEMGHIQYYLQYKDQPIIYREGANPGFHEAVGDVMSLSASTPKHLRAIGLLEEDSKDETAEHETAINHLFSMALDKVAYQPFAYLMDLWRWDVFEGNTNPEQYNCHWWKLREEFQGVEPAVDRSEEDFDPGAKFHIPASVPYIRYFVSNVVQFQFHRALCKTAGQLAGGAPLHQCDIYRSTEAGNLLGQMLQLGASKPWPEAMRLLTGQPRMDASALRDYFAPLEEWLTAENERTGETIGWQPSDKICVQTREELNILREELNRKEELKRRDEEKLRRDEEQIRRDEELKLRAEEQVRRDEELKQRAEEQIRRDEELKRRDDELKRRREEQIRRDEDLKLRNEELKRRTEAEAAIKETDSKISSHDV